MDQIISAQVGGWLCLDLNFDAQLIKASGLVHLDTIPANIKVEARFCIKISFTHLLPNYFVPLRKITIQQQLHTTPLLFPPFRNWTTVHPVTTGIKTGVFVFEEINFKALSVTHDSVNPHFPQ